MQTHIVDELIVVYDVNDWPVELDRKLKSMLEGAGIQHRSQISGGRGLTHARNIGTRMATNEIIFFFDDDVILANDYVEEVLRVYEADRSRGTGGVGGRILGEQASALSTSFGKLFCLTSRRPGIVLRSGSVTTPGNFRDVLQVQVLSGCNMSYRREVFDQFSFDEWYSGYSAGEDMDFSFRVSRRFKLVLTPHALLVHKHASLSRPHAREFAYMQMRNRCYFFMKNMPADATHLICFVISTFGLGLFNFLKFIRRPGRHTLDLCVGTLMWFKDALVQRNWMEKNSTVTEGRPSPLP